MDIVSQIYKHKIVAILRGVSPQDVLSIVTALYQGGICLVEVTLNSTGAIASIEAIVKQMEGKMLVGAGTVLDAESATTSIAAGAQFIISPSVDAHTIEATKKLNVVSIPGAFTATEIVQAYRLGGDIIKLFPASAGLSYFKDIRGPLNHIPLMPTGGISLQNITGFYKAGAIAFGIGSALVKPQPLCDQYLEQLTTTAKQFVASVAE
ncbi:MAG: bifunctional 4-hydroxy-2-oxoglutarate aldolase/2-dehydro-3-deoxy-phosphogluconate aldolase [Chitinophagaceae bacterium]|nr:bifunctional 4-hydroxy-2-oxoglutarate aldolase/2-dehydro-3-deoxy-phosphogluconate aldolase [Chitinophagaceae bacterium]